MTLSDSPTWITLTQGTIEARSRSQAPPLRTRLVTRDVAAALLTAELQRSVAARARVEYAIDTTAVLTYGRRPNHVLHLTTDAAHLRRSCRCICICTPHRPQ